MATIIVRVTNDELLDVIDNFLYYNYKIKPTSILTSHSRRNNPATAYFSVNTADNAVSYTSNELASHYSAVSPSEFFGRTPEELAVLKPMRFRFINPHSDIPLSAHPHAVFTVGAYWGTTYTMINGTEVIQIDRTTVSMDDIAIITPEELRTMPKWYIAKLSDYNVVGFFHVYTGTRIAFTSAEFSSRNYSLVFAARVEVRDCYIPDANGNFTYTFAPITKYFYNDYLKDQIRTRYGFFDRPSSGLSNVIMDSFFPRLISYYNFNIKHMHREETFPRTACAISPLIAEVLNVKKVRTDQLCRVLGYTTQNIKDLLAQVRAKKLNIIFAGTGGTGINTLYWLTELCEMTHSINLFTTITLFEEEDIEYSNIFRFPISLSAYTALTSVDDAQKLYLATPLANKLSPKVEVRRAYLDSTSANHSFNLFNYEYGQTGPRRARSKTNTVIYGAPSLSARAELSEFGNFIAATHANTSCSLWLNPKQEQDIQMESYGMIQLGGFFMNQLRMAIGLLEVLASDQDLSESDKQLLSYEFDGTHKLAADRVYNWQINRNMLMMTAEQATTL